MCPLNTLGNILCQIANTDIKELLLVVGDLANGMDLLNTVGTKLDVGGEVFTAAVLVQWAVNKGWLNNTLLALRSLQQALGKAGTGHGHGQGRRSGPSFGLDDLVTAELDATDVLVILLATQAVSGLGKERDDGGARVTTNNGDVLVGWIRALELGDEAAGADDV